MAGYIFVNYYIGRVTIWPKSFKLLYLLMAFDRVATFYGLELGVISEGNPIMAAGFNAYPLLTLTLKLAFSLLFIEVLCFAIYDKKIKWPQYSIPFFLVIHMVVALMHLHWIGLFLS